MGTVISWTDERKWCRECDTWKPFDAFHHDVSRPDGHTDRCAACRSSNTGTRYAGPLLHERRAKQIDGLAWCRDCANWQPLADVRCGLCKGHQRERDRERYRTDADYRYRRQQHVFTRAHGVEAVSPELAQRLMDRFEGKCAYCEDAATTWDHLTPVSRGGKTVPGNIVPACLSCNSAKRDLDLADWTRSRSFVISLDVLDVIALAIETGVYSE